MFKTNKRNLKVLLLTLIPMLITICYFLDIYVLHKIEFKIAIVVRLVLLVIFIIFLIIILFICFYYNKQINNYNKQIEDYEEQINKDYLTGLNNTRKLNVDLDERIKNKNHFYCMVIDLDDFKYINDTHGHEVGDEILKDFAFRINQIQGAISYRNGGDEFIIIVDDKGDKKEIARILEEIETVETIINIGHIQQKTTFSMGISHFNKTATTKEQLLKKADTEMYLVKRDKKNEK